VLAGILAAVAASSEIATGVVSAAVGLAVGGWWTRANERQRQLREAMIVKSEEISRGASRVVSKLGRNSNDWPPLDRITADPSKWRKTMDEAEQTADAEATRLLGLTGLFFRARSVGTALELIIFARAAAKAGREVDVSDLSVDMAVWEAETQLDEFRYYRDRTWKAFYRLHGELQRDLVSFPSPLGRFVHGRSEVRKTRHEMETIGQDMALLAGEFDRLGAEIQQRTAEIEQKQLARRVHEEAQG
jgi:hypothetical protein